LQQALTIPVVLLFMWLHGNWTQPAMLYLCMHGTYCISWLMKVRAGREVHHACLLTRPTASQRRL
jgi:hypothetical protein